MHLPDEVIESILQKVRESLSSNPPPDRVELEIDAEEVEHEEMDGSLVGQTTGEAADHTHTLLEDGVTSEDGETPHTHMWSEGDEYTSEDVDHKHTLPQGENDLESEESVIPRSMRKAIRDQNRGE